MATITPEDEASDRDGRWSDVAFGGLMALGVLVWIAVLGAAICLF